MVPLADVGAGREQLATAASVESGKTASGSCEQPLIGTALSKNVTVPTGLFILISAVSVAVRPLTMGGNGLADTVNTAEFNATICA